MKHLWVLAGGNGAGKTTFYDRYLAPMGIQFVNADVIARGLDEDQVPTASYLAAKMAEMVRYDLIEAGASFCFETVFSHPSKIDFLAEARGKGYEIVLVFIHLQTNELNQARVAQRVSEGGHDVPADKIVSRIPRTLSNIKAALPLADRVVVYDNSYDLTPYEKVAELKDGEVVQITDRPDPWASELLNDYLAPTLTP